MALMATLGILVLFQSNSGQMEQLALAVAVGAVEAGANIRLRRLASDDAPEIAHRGYGKLAATDLLWADGIVLGIESESPDPRQLEPLFQLLSNALPGQPRPRIAWTFGPENPSSAKSSLINEIEIALQSAGYDVIADDLHQPESPTDPLDAMKQAGRMLVRKLTVE